MWRTTRSFAASLALALHALAFASVPPPLPEAVSRLAPELVPRGGGEFRFLGMKIYDGWFWSAAPHWPTSGTHALDLHYRRDLDGSAIASRSIDEIQRLGYGTADQRARWHAAMLRLFPDIRRGDRMTGVHTAEGVVRYYHNGRLLGEVDDREFGRAFFAIWLDPRTSRTDFRERLLGTQ